MAKGLRVPKVGKWGGFGDFLPVDGKTEDQSAVGDVPEGACRLLLRGGEGTRGEFRGSNLGATPVLRNQREQQ